MSKLMMCQSKDDETLKVSLNGAVMQITELRVRPMNNFATPYELLGRGGARLALTPENLATAMAEYLRYTTPSPLSVEVTQVGYYFRVVKHE